MKRIAAIGLVLAAGLGLSACGSHPITQSYIDGWDAKAQANAGDATGVAVYPDSSCSDVFDGLSNGSDIRSDFEAGCQDAGSTTQDYNSSH